MFITLHCEVNYIFKATMVNMTYFQPLNHEIFLLFKKSYRAVYSKSLGFRLLTSSKQAV